MVYKSYTFLDSKTFLSTEQNGGCTRLVTWKEVPNTPKRFTPIFPN